jgi:uncharacterized protein
MAQLQETARTLQDKMLGKRLYVILTTALASEDDLAEALPRHLEYTIGLERTGVLFASGPFVGASPVPPGSGMSVVRASSLDEARAIAESDPLNGGGLRRFDVREWRLNEGRYTVAVNYSDGTFSID